MKFEEIQRTLATVECPYCCAKSFELKLRCDLGYDHCLPTVQCRGCRHEFDAEELMKTGGQAYGEQCA